MRHICIIYSWKGITYLVRFYHLCSGSRLFPEFLQRSCTRRKWLYPFSATTSGRLYQVVCPSLQPMPLSWVARTSNNCEWAVMSSGTFDLLRNERVLFVRRIKSVNLGSNGAHRSKKAWNVQPPLLLPKVVPTRIAHNPSPMVSNLLAWNFDLTRERWYINSLLNPTCAKPTLDIALLASIFTLLERHCF